MDIREKWNRLAIELGFQLQREIRPYVEMPSLHKMAAQAVKKGDMDKADKLLVHPLIQKMLNKVFIGSACGFYRDYEFALFRSTSSSGNKGTAVYYVNIVLVFPGSLRLGLEVSSSGVGSKIGKILFGGRYQKIPGNPDLDRLIAVKVRDRDRGAAMLSSTDLQEKLRVLYEFSSGFEIADRDIRYSERGHIVDKDKALMLMDMMADVADKMM